MSITVVIISSCTFVIKPLGNRTIMSIEDKPLTADIAALPVSPDVAKIQQLISLSFTEHSFHCKLFIFKFTVKHGHLQH